MLPHEFSDIEVEVLEEVGKGATGSVHRALLGLDPGDGDVDHRREVAAKLLNEKFKTREAAVDSMTAIARQFIKAQHTAHAVKVLGWMIVENYSRTKKATEYEAVCLMELAALVDGRTRTLQDEIADPSTDAEDLLRYCEEVADGLVTLHSCPLMIGADGVGSVVHRDVKPSNVLMMKCKKKNANRGKYYAALCDFGLARDHLGTGITASTTMYGAKGTAGYIAPEVLSGKAAATPSSDMYSLGQILREVFYKSASPHGASTMTSAVHDSLRLIVDRLVSEDPARRPSADELKKALRDIRGQLPPPKHEALRRRLDDLVAEVAATYFEYRKECGRRGVIHDQLQRSDYQATGDEASNTMQVHVMDWKHCREQLAVNSHQVIGKTISSNEKHFDPCSTESPITASVSNTGNAATETNTVMRSPTAEEQKMIFSAAASGKIEALVCLKEAKVDVGYPYMDTNGVAPLYIACENGHVDVVKCLIAAGCNKDAARQDGWTPRRLAVFKADPAMVRLFS